ncbi:MAG: thiamine pyrophosphate-dependent enzyme [Dissulfurispiraceae bacterium]
MNNRILMIGNEAIARGLVENSCSMVLSYPGTPASEILPGVVKWKTELSLSIHTQWAVNEKIAFEIAYAGSIAGLRTVVSMKQVGLNVASDPLMSAAYMGANGGFIVVSADDPGPHSSQTEQDSRLMAMIAKVPVLDPAGPEQAKAFIGLAYELSEAFEIPVMLRPTTRVCHGGQDVELKEVKHTERAADFRKDPARWAATPKFRYILHSKLNDKLLAIAANEDTKPRLLNPGVKSPKAVVTSGVVAAHATEIMADLDLLNGVALYQVIQPFPLHSAFIEDILGRYEEILVIEESAPVIEMQIAARHKVRGRLNGAIPAAGELLPEGIEWILSDFCSIPKPDIKIPPASARRPSLCAGCPHRASFFAIKKAVPGAIYTSDIGCYTLGLNLGAIDTALCMGASISQAAGFFQAFKLGGKYTDIVATIGDSTFFHAGVPALIDAVVQDARFVLVVLDNSTTAMTGSQPTPMTGIDACGNPLAKISLERLVKSCGVKFCRVGDPYDMPAFTKLLRSARQHAKEKGLSVVISRQPCLVDKRIKDVERKRIDVAVSSACDGCSYCIKQFECPAIEYDEIGKRARINRLMCSGCGICIHVCPKKAIEKMDTE